MFSEFLLIHFLILCCVNYNFAQPIAHVTVSKVNNHIGTPVFISLDKITDLPNSSLVALDYSKANAQSSDDLLP